MGNHKFTKGTGITAEPRVKYDGEDIPAAITAWLTGWGNAWRKGGGDYGAVTLDLIETCQEILQAAGEGRHAPDSQADFAERILWHHEIAKAEIAKGNADGAARQAVHVGYLCCQASMKWKWEPHALRGLGTLKATKAGHEAVHGTDAEKMDQWQRLVDDFNAEVAKGTKKSAADRIVAELHNVSYKKVQRARLKYLKKS